MNENENNFESLRRLLALKRHETPPPGYFEKFPREVTARIRAGETGGTESGSELLSWLFRFLSAFESKPAFAGGFASVLCLLLLFGIVYAERPDVAPQPLLQPVQIATGPLINATPVALNSFPAEQTGFVSSTNPIFNPHPAAPWFNPQPATVQQVNLRLLGN
jgi:hypothetical protein